MTIPEPPGPGPRRPHPGPATGMDPMPDSTLPRGPADDIPEPGDPGRRPDEIPVPDGRMALVATGREDRRRHVVDVESGEFGDPTGLRARCGAPVEHVVPGLRAESADCPGCRLDVLR